MGNPPPRPPGEQAIPWGRIPYSRFKHPIFFDWDRYTGKRLEHRKSTYTERSGDSSGSPWGIAGEQESRRAGGEQEKTGNLPWSPWEPVGESGGNPGELYPR